MFGINYWHKNLEFEYPFTISKGTKTHQSTFIVELNFRGIKGYGEAPADANCGIVRSIVLQHLNSPAMWAVFQLQDLFAMRDELRLIDPADERINVPGDANHFWRFRIHITLEDLLKNDNFNEELKNYIHSCGRSCLA